MPPTTPGLVHIPSPHSVRETMDRLQSMLQQRGIKIFCRIDHSAEAFHAGLAMRDCQLLLFGSPLAGTPIMVAAPTAAIDLPLKALAWTDEHNKVWLSLNTPEYLQERHGFPKELMANISVVLPLLEKAAA